MNPIGSPLITQITPAQSGTTSISVATTNTANLNSTEAINQRLIKNYLELLGPTYSSLYFLPIGQLCEIVIIDIFLSAGRISSNKNKLWGLYKHLSKLLCDNAWRNTNSSLNSFFCERLPAELHLNEQVKKSLISNIKIVIGISKLKLFAEHFSNKSANEFSSNSDINPMDGVKKISAIPAGK